MHVLQHFADLALGEMPRQYRRDIFDHAATLFFLDRFRRRADECHGVLIATVLVIVGHLDARRLLAPNQVRPAKYLTIGRRIAAAST